MGACGFRCLRRDIRSDHPNRSPHVPLARSGPEEYDPLRPAPRGAGQLAAGLSPQLGVIQMNHDSHDDGDEEDKGASEFARALREFESTRGTESPAIGSRVRGRVIQLTEDFCFIDFGGRSEGAMDLRAYSEATGDRELHIGDELELYVVDNRDQVTLAPSIRADPAVALSQVTDARLSGMPISGRVTGTNSGGLEVEIAGLRAFCPVSQIDAGFCPDPSVFVGRTLEFLVTEVAEKGRRLVVSRKALLRREEEGKAREVLAGIRVGSELDGTVARLESFGAFVNLGGVDGLVHVSEIRYGRTENPADVLSVGQKVRVKVLSVQEKEDSRPKISLSIKAAQPDPWDEVSESFWPGRRVQGTVVRLAEFGAFVTLAPGIDGLVHVSEVDLRPVAHPKDKLAMGQPVEAVVLSIDTERKRISLSIKDVLAADGLGAIGEAGVSGEAGAGQPKAPTVGDIVDGWVAGIKPFGLFADLPIYGHRARALVPHEETGERRGTDLSRRFRIGDQVRLEVIEVDSEGRIKASMTKLQDRAAEDAFKAYQAGDTSAPKKGPATAMEEALRRAMADSPPKPSSGQS
jgi:small subunit ribosomal protein S1